MLRCRDSQPNDTQQNDTMHKNSKNVKHSIKLTMLSAIILILSMLRGMVPMLVDNGTASFKKCKQMFEYLHLLLLSDICWSKF
jgi:hypothetical protein